MTVTINEMITEVRRELTMREYVYPKQVERGKLKQHVADVHMARLQAVLKLLVDRKRDDEPTLGF